MSNKRKDSIITIVGYAPRLVKNVMSRFVAFFLMCSMLYAGSAFAQQAAPFKANSLVKQGDNVKFGSYIIYKLGEGIYKINDPGTTTGSAGAWGVDMYLICGEKKALMIDLGNNYIEGKAGNEIAPRKNAAEELRAVVYGLAGKLPLEITLTHGHGDHTGMSSAFQEENVMVWKSKFEEVNRRPKVDTLSRPGRVEMPKVFTLFTPGEKTFDLGGGRIVETLMLQGHTTDGTVYILENEGMLFTGDSMGGGFGLAFENVADFKKLVEGTQRLVDYINTNFTPYKRYALKVFTGHSWQNNFVGFVGLNTEKVEVGYLDWRFIQNMASCAKGILEGKWLVKGSGLVHVGDMPYVDYWGNRAVGRAIMVYGIGCVVMPIKIAFEAAGMKLPE